VFDKIRGAGRSAVATLMLMKVVSCLFAIGLASAFPLHAAFPDSPLADLVLGAADFDTAGGATADAENIDYPIGVAVDPVSGKLFVSSNSQHRILRYANVDALANGAAAEAVIGQTSLTGSGSGTTRSTLNTPLGICLDSQGRLWVAEVNNHRVLMFEDAANLANGADASLVIGQTDFVSNGPGGGMGQFQHPSAVFIDAADNLWVCDYLNNRVLKFPDASTLTNGASATVEIGGYGTSASGLYHPIGVLVDAGDRLWIVEQTNNRVVRFENAGQLTTGASASGVLGQPGFGSGSQNGGATGMRVPSALAMDAEGTLWVADHWNNRVLGFRNAATKENGAAADQVIGQPDFDSASAGTSAGGFHRPIGMAFDESGRLWIADAENDRVLRFSPEPSPPDQAGPALTVTTKIPRVTTRSRLRISGAALDPSGVAAVRYRVGKGPFRNAAGTNSWTFVAPLGKGKNTVRITASDTLGNTAPVRTLRVTRKR
jgi:sugar lactone lactonase YvrE